MSVASWDERLSWTGANWCVTCPLPKISVSPHILCSFHTFWRWKVSDSLFSAFSHWLRFPFAFSMSSPESLFNLLFIFSEKGTTHLKNIGSFFLFRGQRIRGPELFWELSLFPSFSQEVLSWVFEREFLWDKKEFPGPIFLNLLCSPRRSSKLTNTSN